MINKHKNFFNIKGLLLVSGFLFSHWPLVLPVLTI